MSKCGKRILQQSQLLKVEEYPFALQVFLIHRLSCKLMFPTKIATSVARRNYLINTETKKKLLQIKCVQSVFAWKYNSRCRLRIRENE